MTTFEYIVAIHSIVLGLATTVLLSTLAGLLKYGDTSESYWVHTVWCVALLFSILSTWWGFWHILAPIDEITIFEFLATFQFSILLFFAASLLSPDLSNEHTIEIEAYFYRIKTPFLSSVFFGFLFLTLGLQFGLIPEPVEDDGGVGIVTGIMMMVILLVGVASANRMVHGLIVVAFFSLQLIQEALQHAVGT